MAAQTTDSGYPATCGPENKHVQVEEGWGDFIYLTYDQTERLLWLLKSLIKGHPDLWPFI